MSYKKRNKDGPSSSKMATDPESVMDFDFKTIMKEVELLGNSRMTWKEKQEVESRKVVALGGKPPKKQRVPLSVARVQMKNQKEREQKMLKRNLAISRLGGHVSMTSSSAPTSEKRKTKERSLKCTEGYFRNGVLSVNHLLKQQQTPWRDSHGENHVSVGGNSKGKGKGKKKMGGKKNKGRKGKGRR